jgi:hypothetical protein
METPITWSESIANLVKDIRTVNISGANKRVLAMVITKLQEAQLLAEHLQDQDF